MSNWRAILCSVATERRSARANVDVAWRLVWWTGRR